MRSRAYRFAGATAAAALAVAGLASCGSGNASQDDVPARFAGGSSQPPVAVSIQDTDVTGFGLDEVNGRHFPTKAPYMLSEQRDLTKFSVTGAEGCGAFKCEYRNKITVTPNWNKVNGYTFFAIKGNWRGRNLDTTVKPGTSTVLTDQKGGLNLIVSKPAHSNTTNPGELSLYFTGIPKRLSSYEVVKPPKTPGSLREANLTGMNLSRLNLMDTDFSGADLSNASLTSALMNDVKLKGANLTGTKLQHASLIDANLDSVDLSGLQFTDVNFTGALFDNGNLKKATFKDTRLAGASFENADLENATFDLKQLEWELLHDNMATAGAIEGANFTGANLKNTDLSKLNLIETRFDGSNADSADFSNSDLSRASFEDAKARRASFKKAVLFLTKFINTDLSGASFDDAILRRDGTGKTNSNSTSSDPTATRFNGANLTGATFKGTKVDGVPFGEVAGYTQP